ncbi:Primosomal protein N' [Saliniradius amylolyticus]|uniref:Replication restart protein PriA n=1 Tax=Saliniradius amylolyticus TaxID=2183582 RepID=A0A2S2E0Y3_9ALTE|nr:primosomal protein N' [Saliniradius amylolyticus]AWL10687.1 Primosomal protein N' [Saliniradius amylolyticus]
MTKPIAQIALPVPMRRLFDYSLPEPLRASALPGVRVQVPFGSRRLVGIVVTLKSESDVPTSKLRNITEVLDSEPVLHALHQKWLHWASQYYQHPIGEIYQAALPVSLRKGLPAEQQHIKMWRTLGDEDAAESLKRAPRQKALYQLLKQQPLTDAALKQEFSPQVFKGLEEKSLIECYQSDYEPDTQWFKHLDMGPAPRPNVEQSLAISGINQLYQQFGCVLLEGVTGSGKTEVYLQCIEPLLKSGHQVLILVPEIGLTPQTVQRFERRFGLPVGLLHSGLTDNERLSVWQKARSGELGIIIGTRSAIFTPLARPGMIIVDEEHDHSYKQQDGWRYHARDMAVVRASLENIPLVLGSATPSLESLNNALTGKYRHYLLKQRAGNAEPVKQQMLDVKDQPLKYGLAAGMQDKIAQHLQRGQQVMLFINRRGYAPALICHHCGHVEMCQRCDTSFTLHRRQNKLQCHHCGDAKPLPRACPSCQQPQLTPVGLGTEQLEQGLTELFPEYRAVRIDSDATRGKQKLHQLLEDIQQGDYQLLIGTQILAKGHHFPNVSLVVIVDVDAALFSADYRAAEKLAQLITQVSGRAGRAHVAGELWLQTHNPSHPLLQDLLNNGYQHFARYALSERQFANLPPFSHQALVRAESHDPRQAFEFLSQARTCFADTDGVLLTGPLPALVEKRQGRFRFQLLLQTAKRTGIQQALNRRLPQMESLSLAPKVRWSVDIDPQDFS